MNALSFVFEHVVRARRRQYERRPERRRRLDRPVISVGNLAVGGSGKTPVVAAVARLARELGYRPAVLSRGYGRRRGDEGVVVVSDGSRLLETAERGGDEPVMLARELPGVPVLVSPNRYLAGRLAEKAFGSTVLLLDDGFQHLQLARDVDLLVLSPADLEDRVLPAGRLREPIDTAGRADALLVYGDAGEAQRLAEALASRAGAGRAERAASTRPAGWPPVFHVTRHYEPLRWLVPPRGREGKVPDAPACCGRVLALCGIARPERFLAALAELRWHVAREVRYPDHYWYRARDAARIAALAREASVDLIVTTAKDAARLECVLPHAPVDATVPWAVLPMRAGIEPDAGFRAWLAARLDGPPAQADSTRA